MGRGSRSSRGGQSKGRMHNYFENPTSYTHQPASRATNESSVIGQEGVRKKDKRNGNVKNNRNETRIGCKARMAVSNVKNEWVVTEVLVTKGAVNENGYLKAKVALQKGLEEVEQVVPMKEIYPRQCSKSKRSGVATNVEENDDKVLVVASDLKKGDQRMGPGRKGVFGT
ncbi:hypothetical protein IFM89_017915 [Coptis chinensis]|uniref:FAR1 domain-containing protein n=1 Tax=Coptis chinensis TaxID=261450 RepID=A0A835ITZ6_9MAGN|nr:hypothetical protein IFM89_017915 [Coptis chinensis]